MQIVEVAAGRWIVMVGNGLELEVQLAGGRAWGFWRFAGELFAEVDVGEG